VLSVLPRSALVLTKLDRELLSKYLLPEWRRTLALSVLLLAGIGSQLANPEIAKTFIDQASAGATLRRLIGTATVFLVVAIVVQITTVAEAYVAEDLGWRTTNELRADLLQHVLSLDATFHSEHTTGELIERIDGDV